MSGSADLGADREQALLEIARSPEMASGDLRSVVVLATRAAAKALDVERVGVWFLDVDRNVLECLASYRRSSGTVEQPPPLNASELPEYFAALESGRTLAVDDAVRDPRTAGFGPEYLGANGISSMLDATIRVDGKVIGAVCHEHVGDPRHWTRSDIHFAGALADQIAQARLNAERRDASASKEQLQDELEVSRRHEAVGRLAAGLIHDLNNLLFVVLANAELLGDAALEQEDRSFVDEIRLAAARSGDLLATMLKFGGDANETSDSSVGAVMAGLMPLLRRLTPDDVQIRASTPDPRARVACSRGALEQILLNLVLNARDAIDGPGVIEIDVRWVDEAPDEAPDETPVPLPAAIIIVRDDGPGVPEDARDWIFRPFFSTKPEALGTGLGLSTVKALVETARGSIEVGRPSRGAEFIVWLRAAADPIQDAQPTVAKRDRRLLPKGRALVAGDDPAACRALSEHLRREGFTVFAAANGAEAVAIYGALEEKPSLLVFDAAMPEMSGVDAARAIRSASSLPPLVLVSNRGVEQPATDGAIRLAKPFTRGTLAAAIQTAMKR